MYLKRIEIFGFKSFAEKTELQFANNISAIVGPNGSGKSNIVDAIRWVIGEQSIKNLRGSRLEDVIFAGTEKRKPLGYAQVSLVLDNSDGYLALNYSEVVITRRFYRSGESQFLINNNECRLKDIQELMLDTGLGKEAYSIIGQGKVEEILTSNPQERRTVFEEAAGIVKYKIRQREAVKKLADAEQNLLRLADLIQEIGSQLPHLEEQAEKAQQYKQIDDKLNFLEKRVALKSWHEISHTLADCQKQLNSLYKELSLCEGELTREELNGQVHQQNLMEMEQAITQKQSQRDRLINEQSLLERKIDVGKEKIRSWTEKLERLESELIVLNEQIKVSIEKETEAKARYLALNQELSLLKQDLLVKEGENSELKHSLEKLEKQLEQNKEELIDLLNETARIKNQLHRINLEFNQLDKSLAKYREQHQVVSEQKRKLDEKVDRLKEDYRKTELKQKQIQEQITKEKIEFSQRENNLLQLKTKTTKTKEQMQMLSARLRTLQDLEKQKTGYNQGVKAVVRGKAEGIKQLVGIYGAVVDLIKVTPGYELALEVALGAGLQYVITENEAAARAAVGFLKEGKLGRVTFLPLDLLSGGEPIAFNHLKGNTLGLIGSALDLVSFDSKYTNAIQFLLNRVLIAEDLNTAVQLSRRIPKGGRIVTIDGELVTAAGTITGGSWQKGKSSGLLGRKREIEQIRTELIGLTEQFKQQNRDLEKEQQLLTTLKDKLVYLEEQSGQERLKIDGLTQEIRYNDSLIKENADKLDLSNLEMAELIRQREQLGLEKEQLLRDIVTQEQLVAENKSVYAKLKEQLEDSTLRYSQLNQGNIDLKVKLAGLEERLVNYKKNWQETEYTKKENQQRLDALRTEHSELTEQRNFLSTQIKELEEQLITIIDANIQLAQGLKQEQEKRNERVVAWQLLEQKLRSLRKRQGELQKKTNEQEIKVAEYELEAKHLKDYLLEQHSVDNPKELIERNPDLIAVPGNTGLEIQQLKQLLEGMQPVNLGSIEEVLRVRERYDFLKGQSNDLIEAKKGLIKVIREMENKMEKRFLAAMDQIKTDFNLVYNQLFDGGKAELILTDEDNPLTSGVEIIAQPPGKKQQNLSLLSGGEKALTAIALLFAVLRFKKSPFCVLDEIDAALDDANVQRLAEFIDQHAPVGQYIIITHQKGTMSIADILYGVTMEDAGISKIVSVKLTDREQAAV